ncbi:MAG: sugar phosphate isomerase/epimerase [Eubacterium sp.]|nr:sugar phosphate isomerase/epimerase [Eubacterium sp.]
MRKISVMTMTMFFQMFYKVKITGDMDEFVETYEEMMEIVSESGYTAVDITDMEVQLLGTEGIDRILGKYHLAVSSYIHFDAYALPDEEGFEARVEAGKKAADIAEHFGTTTLMLVPQAHSGIEELSPEQIRERLAEHFGPIVSYAKQKGITTVVEDTPDLKLHFCTQKEVREVLDAVPDLRLVYDSGNVILVDEDPAEYYEAFRDRVGYIHMKDMQEAPAGAMMAEYATDGRAMTSAPSGTGMIDFANVCRLVKDSGYEGYVTVEFRVDDDGDYRKSLVRCREYFEGLLAGNC